ncbi:MAG: beta-propeller domain-containing protein [Candidatus Zixiibacteriota bacterium]|nr:MAG: beta-propeller domain-containing protein [candidate division Zixibacteria bacterium]
MSKKILTRLVVTLSLAAISVIFVLPLRAQESFLPDSAVVKLSSTLWSDLRDVKFNGTKAYSLFFDGLAVVDLSNVNSPSQIGQVELPGEGLKLDVSGNRACVAAADSSVHIIDISSASQPLLENSFGVPDVPTDIAVGGNCAYVSAKDSGFLVLDISDPLNVSVMGSCGLPEFQALSLCLRENIAYLAGAGGLRLINVFFPYTPFLFGSSDAVPGGNKVLAAAAGGRTYAYMGNPVQLSILDVTNPRDIFSLSTYFSTSAIADMMVWGDHAYLGLTYDGLLILDVSDRSLPEEVAALSLGDNTRGVFFHSGFVFVSDHFEATKVINTFNPDRPFAAGSWIIPGTCKDVAVGGDFAHVMCDHSGLHILNVEDPSQPQMAGVLHAPYNNNDVEVEGSYAYITALLTGMQVIDVSDPYDPQAVQSYQPDGYTYGVTVKDGFAYLLNGGNDIQIINVQNPLSLAPAGSVSTPGSAQEVFVAGDYLYAADRSAGVTTISVADKDNPYVVTSMLTVGDCTDIFASGGRLYLACEGQGMQICHLTNPETPESLGFYSTSADIKDLFVEGDYTCLTLQDNRIEVVDVSTPSTPLLAAAYDMLDRPGNLMVRDQHIYLCDNRSFKLFRFFPPSPLGKASAR